MYPFAQAIAALHHVPVADALIFAEDLVVFGNMAWAYHKGPAHRRDRMTSFRRADTTSYVRSEHAIQEAAQAIRVTADQVELLAAAKLKLDRMPSRLEASIRGLIQLFPEPAVTMRGLGIPCLLLQEHDGDARFSRPNLLEYLRRVDGIVVHLEKRFRRGLKQRHVARNTGASTAVESTELVDLLLDGATSSADGESEAA
jgi:hypothetical protein